MSNRRSEVRPRERLISAAYNLFSKDGISQVGIDTILAKSGCAKASLYTNFKNKVELAIAFLDRREATAQRAAAACASSANCLRWSGAAP